MGRNFISLIHRGIKKKTRWKIKKTKVKNDCTKPALPVKRSADTVINKYDKKEILQLTIKPNPKIQIKRPIQLNLIKKTTKPTINTKKPTINEQTAANIVTG